MIEVVITWTGIQNWSALRLAQMHSGFLCAREKFAATLKAVGSLTFFAKRNVEKVLSTALS